jgi:uncharacterized protein (UPF0333 family)
MEEKAQVPIEFLLVVLGGIVIATTVALYVKNAANSASQAVQAQADANT